MLGILGDRQLLAGEVELDAAAAHRACEDLGRRLGMSAVEAAWGIRRIANSAMAGAVRAVSVGRGHDPRDFAIIAFGGAGPMHAADIAREIGVTRLVVPAVPGCHSALGMVVTDVAHDYSVSTLAVAESGLEERLNSAFTALERLATSDLRQDGIADHRQLLLRTLDMRYYGQHSHLNVTINTAHPSWLDLALARFHKDHERLYGFMVPDETVEIVNARLRALGQLADHHGRTEPPSAPVDVQAPEPIERRRIYFGPSANESLLTALYDRRAVTPGTHLRDRRSSSKRIRLWCCHQVRRRLLMPGETCSSAWDDPESGLFGSGHARRYQGWTHQCRRRDEGRRAKDRLLEPLEGSR